MSEDLIGRADSLMRRSRSFVAGRATPAPADDGIPLLTEEVDLAALLAEPEDRTEEITAAVTADVTARVTAEVTAAVTERVSAEVTRRVTDDVTARVTAEVTEQVTGEVTERVTREVSERVAQDLTWQVTERVTEEVGAQVRKEVTQQARRASSDALAHHFADLAGLIQSLIDDWSSTTLPALVNIEMRAAVEAAMGDAVRNATARIREQAVLDLRDTIAGEIEARSVAVVTAALSSDPSEAPDQPL